MLRLIMTVNLALLNNISITIINGCDSITQPFTFLLGPFQDVLSLAVERCTKPKRQKGLFILKTRSPM